MTRYIVERFAHLAPVLVGISIAVFLVMRVVPGDPAIAMLGEQADPTRLAQVRINLGLDKSLVVQYFVYIRGVLVGDFGRSILNNRPVLSELTMRFPATIELTLAAMFLGGVVGLPLGIVAATRRGGFVDAFTMTLSLVGVSLPIFWLGLILIWFFALVLGWLPVSGRIDAGLSVPGVTNFLLIDTLIAGDLRAFGNALRHLALPALTLATIPLAEIARMTRSSVLEVLGEDYVRTARAKGLAGPSVVARHVLRNAAIPIVTLLGLQLGRLLGGAVITETIFSWPGVGRFILEGVLGRDYPIVQGAVLLVTVVYTLVNLAVDVSYGWIDPRVRADARTS